MVGLMEATLASLVLRPLPSLEALNRPQPNNLLLSVDNVKVPSYQS